MKKLFTPILFCALLIALLLSLASCVDTPLNNDVLDVTLIEKGAETKYILIYGESKNAMGAAELCKNLFAQRELAVYNPTPSALGQIDEEILFGETDRQVSIDAFSHLNAISPSSSEDVNYVICYNDGKLAIAANSYESYNAAIIDLLSYRNDAGNIVIKDNFKKFVSMTEDEYDLLLKKFDDAEFEEQRQNNAPLIAGVIEKLNSQRDMITLGELFGKSTLDINDIIPSKWAAPLNNPIDEHPRLLVNKANLPRIREMLREYNPTNREFLSLVNKELANNGILPEPKPGTTLTEAYPTLTNYDSSYLAVIQAKALAYLIYSDEYYGYEAILYMKNYLESLDIVFDYSAQNQGYYYSNVMFTAALVYDWCYDLLTKEDKEQFIAGIENRIARYENQTGPAMSIGFPPSRLGSVVGTGSYIQLLRSYLSVSVAIYDENPSWWDYVAGRFYAEYKPARDYFFASGITHQGTNYTGRHTADVWADWIVTSSTGEHPYTTGTNVTVKGHLQYEFAPGKLFSSGDGQHIDYTGTEHAITMAFIAAYIYGDSTLLAQAEYILGNGVFKDVPVVDLSSALYVALRGVSVTDAKADRYDGMELIHYNKSPVGEYVARLSWGDDAAAAIVMRIKERTPGNHEHEDTGTFEIYYKGMLTSDGGRYDNNTNSVMEKTYFRGTIGHNGLIVYNPNITHNYNYSGTRLYTGGQRRNSEPSNLDAFLNDKYTMGKVTGNQHGYLDNDKTKPLYAYIAGDITSAYEAGDANYVGRRMLTVFTGNSDFPMAFFVYDEIDACHENSEKRFLLQITSPNAPTIKGRYDAWNGTAYVTEGKAVTSGEFASITTENGGGRLVLTSLSDNVKFRLAGGRNEGKYAPANSWNYTLTHVDKDGNVTAIQCQTGASNAAHSDDGHWGRVEIVSTANTNTAQFMNVLYVADAGQEKEAPDITKISGDGVKGGTFGNIAAIFATSRDRVSTEISASVSGDGDMSYYVSGVAAGEWEITVDGTSYGTATATEEGGLLTFTAPGGHLELNMKK